MEGIKDISDLLQSNFFYDIVGNKNNIKQSLLNVAQTIFRTYYPSLKKVKIKYIDKSEFEELRKQIKSGHATYGYFSPVDNTIYLNPALHMMFEDMAKSKNPFYPYEIFDTIIHEGRHAEQFANGTDLLNNPHSTVRIHTKDAFIALCDRLSDIKMDLCGLVEANCKYLPLELKDECRKFLQELEKDFLKELKTNENYYSQLVERDARVFALQSLMNMCLQNKDTAALSFIDMQLKEEKAHAHEVLSQTVFQKECEDCQKLLYFAKKISEQRKVKFLPDFIAEGDKIFKYIDDYLVGQWGQLYLDAKYERSMLDEVEQITGRYEQEKSVLSQDLLDTVNGVAKKKELESTKKNYTGKEMLQVLKGETDGMTGKEVLEIWDEIEKPVENAAIQEDDVYEFDEVSINLRYLKDILSQPATTELELLSKTDFQQAQQLVEKLETWIKNGYTLATPMQKTSEDIEKIVEDAKSTLPILDAKATEDKAKILRNLGLEVTTGSKMDSRIQAPAFRAPNNPSYSLFDEQGKLYDSQFGLDPYKLENRFCECIGRQPTKFGTLGCFVKVKNEKTKDLGISIGDKSLMIAYCEHLETLMKTNEKLGIGNSIGNSLKKPPELV